MSLLKQFCLPIVYTASTLPGRDLMARHIISLMGIVNGCLQGDGTPWLIRLLPLPLLFSPILSSLLSPFFKRPFRVEVLGGLDGERDREEDRCFFHPPSHVRYGPKWRHQGLYQPSVPSPLPPPPLLFFLLLLLILLFFVFFLFLFSHFDMKLLRA